MSKNHAYSRGLAEFSGINYQYSGNNIDDIESNRILNLFNLKDVPEDQLVGKLNELTPENLSKKERLLFWQRVFDRAKDVYRETFLVDIKKPFTDKKFHSQEDVIAFLSHSYNSSNIVYRQVYCDLIKLMYGIIELECNESLKNAKEITKKFVMKHYVLADNKIGRFEFSQEDFENTVEGKDYYQARGVYYKKMSGGGEKKIHCTLRFRGKTLEKMLVKILGSEKESFNMVDLVSDCMGIELEANTKQESLYLLEYIYHIHKTKGNIAQTQFRQKADFYQSSLIEKAGDEKELDLGFRNSLKKLDSVRKKNSHEKYQDCKFQGMINTTRAEIVGCESRVVIKGNKNQSGLAASEIIDGKKIIRAMIGLRGWVSKSYVNRIVQNIKKHPHILKDAAQIKDDMYSELMKVDIPKRSNNIYSTLHRLREIVKNADEYPELIISAIKRELEFSTPEDVIRWAKDECSEIV